MAKKMTITKSGIEYIEMSDAEIQEAIARFDAEYFNNKLAEIREQRDSLLRETDFTQLSDAPLTAEQKDAYASYRQALRDLPESITIDNIDSVQFPAKPE